MRTRRLAVLLSIGLALSGCEGLQIAGYLLNAGDVLVNGYEGVKR